MPCRTAITRASRLALGSTTGAGRGAGASPLSGRAVRCLALSSIALLRRRDFRRALKGGEPSYLLHHGAQTVASRRREVLIQTKAFEEPFHVERRDLAGGLPGQQPLEQSDQSAHDVRVAVAEEIDDVRRSRPFAHGDKN